MLKLSQKLLASQRSINKIVSVGAARFTCGTQAVPWVSLSLTFKNNPFQIVFLILISFLILEKQDSDGYWQWRPNW